MKAIDVDETTRNLQLVDLPVPEPGPGEVRIAVAATAVNRADLLQRRGLYPPPPGASPILGLEVAGIVDALGAEVTGIAVGDEVCALLAGGGYAEYAIAPAAQCLPVPAGVPLVDAAALPEGACTVYSNVVMEGGLRAGETLLIHGGGSGIGTHAIQLGKALGATVAVTVGSEYKARRCRELGADIVIDYHAEDFAEVLRDRADVILDIMGARYLPRNIRALAPQGRLVIIGMQGGVDAELNIAALLRKRGRISATNLRGRPAVGPHSKAEVVAAVREHVWPLFADGALRPVVSARLPFAEANAAHDLLDSPESVGKVVLTP
ncbi:NAD(P)H-quinone oxidoreductase [Tsukamurella pseudospumae]|uniref:NADPH:quinone oxidoreductase n=1 Tax=Tsukamurella pseudospumae TaxID=239498 RepID=A0A138AU97_9ACTN|nr:NAD(P)H-quinone oxidoreductase [Tsukamurella pseudospumae]KXO98977.1 NADPH:quinone oxidoreductase [Tsukamurella pseudospumae]KXP14004.1 NADPH:quinone oxidoreductase [Tsukamurella pseudospumae]